MSSFPLRILTPEGPVVDAEVESLVVTAFNGSLGVLAGHAPMIAAVVIGPGKVLENGMTRWFVFGEGTLEVRGPDVVLLVDFSEVAENYEAAKVQTAQAVAAE